MEEKEDMGVVLGEREAVVKAAGVEEKEKARVKARVSKSRTLEEAVEQT